MLQRAASHAYSWWWASHIRTKQSKWLEQSLQDMEEKVQGMLLIIEGDGDSFAKRAEMYYRRRPELICAVEEAYKVFRALTDRYDLLSKDLQNANHTIATVFPEQIQFPMADDDEIPKIPDNFPIPENLSKIPQVPKAPTKDLKTIISKASKQFQAAKTLRGCRQKAIVKSGLSKEEALDEVGKLQKEILSLQTMKEFVKSSYESGIAKYWGIENQVMDMQQKISRLQDEFNMDSMIEDEEARTLMAEAALKSCQETLAMLQEKQDKTTREAEDEYKRFEAACDRLKSIREKYLLEQSGVGGREGGEPHMFSPDVADLIKETKEIEELPEKVEENLDMGSLGSLSVSQLAEKIDLVVNKVFNLETAVSSQTVLVNTLRSETDDLNSHIRNLEDGNEIVGDDTRGLSTRVKYIDDKLNKVQDLTKDVEIRNNSLETRFARTRTSLDHLAEKLSSVKEDDEVEEASSTSMKAGVVMVADTANGDQPSENVKSDHLPDISLKVDEEMEASPNLDHNSGELSSGKQDEEMEASGNLDHDSREELSSEKPDQEMEANANLDHISRKLSSGNPDEVEEGNAYLDYASRKLSGGNPGDELEAHENLDHSSRKLSSVNADEDLEAHQNLDHTSRKLSSGNPDEELVAHENLDHDSRKLNSSNTDQELEAHANHDDSSREPSSGKLDEARTYLDQEGEVDVTLVESIRLSVSSTPEQEEDEKVIRKARNCTTVEEVLHDEADDENPQTKNRSKAEANEEEEGEEEDDDISWQQILLSGMEDREKILLKEYTTILRNYKEVKKKLNDIEKKERDTQFDTTIKMRQLKRAITKKDEEIMHLRRRLGIEEGDNDLSDWTSISEDQFIQSEPIEVSTVTRDIKGPPLIDEDSENSVIFLSKCPSISRAEEKLRTEIDAILDENLDFWFRFSTAFHQIQKFKTEARDLEDEITKLKSKRKPDKSEVMPIYKHLTEIQRELTIWLDQSVPLKDELKNRFASLCSIQGEITKALKEGVEADEIRFSSHQAAKLQGEVLNMKQENDKVREELEAGLDHVRMLQLQIEKTLTQLNEEFGISNDQSQNRRVPLRSFIFGNKSKKSKSSLFSLMHPNRKYQILRGGSRQSSHGHS